MAIATPDVWSRRRRRPLRQRSGQGMDMAAFPPGRRLRILPNHSCFAAAAYERYHVVDGAREVAAVWERVNGW